MSPAGTAFALGLTVLFGALFYVVYAWWREATVLDLMMGPNTRSDAVLKLSGPIGEAAATLDRALIAHKGVDEALTSAIATVSKADLAPPGPRAIAIDVLIAVSALSPLAACLLGAADQISALPRALEGLEPASAYVSAVQSIPAAFVGVSEGAVYSTLLIFVAALVAVCRYALLRSEVREARAIRAFVHGTAAAAPEATAPQAAKLLALLTPSTSLRPAFAATIAFMALSAAAVYVLTQATDLRVANALPLSYAGWPQLHIESGEVQPPALPAGRALGNGPSLIVGRDRVQLGAQTITGLEDGQLMPGWETQAMANPIPEGARPLLVAGAAADLGTLLGVMKFLETKGATEFQWVIDRKLPSDPNALVQSSLPVTLGTVEESASTIDIDASGVRIGGSVVKLAQLRERVGASRAGRFGVRVHGPLSYGQVVEILAAADGVCEGSGDCGLPGRGLAFVIQQSE